MRVRQLMMIALIMPLCVKGVSAQVSDTASEIRWEPTTGQAVDGSTIEGRLGRIRVPENRGLEEGPLIEIAFVVFPSTNPEPGPPIVYLAGGPGGSGVRYCMGPATDPRINLLRHGDVIGIDQRGTGLSRPNLSEAPEFTYELPLDRAVDRNDLIAAFQGAAERCIAHWTEQGVDLAAYNSIESADDVDAVRRALGLEKIITYGESYGSHLSLAYLRRHADHVERAVMLKVEGPDQTWKLPSNVHRRLVQLHEMVAADAALSEHIPDFLGLVSQVLAQLKKEPVTVPLPQWGPDASITIGPYDLQLLLASGLASSRNLAGMPAAVYYMSKGHWAQMGGMLARYRRGDVGSAMTLMMDCSSGASTARLARIAREMKDTTYLLSDALSAPFYPETCDACGNPDLGDEFRGALECDAPVLFASGDLDARTPPSNVDEIRAGFSNYAHLLIEGTGHDSRELMSETYQELVHAFLRGEKVESQTITLPPIPLQPVRSN